ncbi:hypothetical protein BDF20DRAFT_909294 [Mycotypha africana]|uniref:uncharacterized protein n=1 Tax=Mycotypha africana TaxID=64632 RepID=UPI0023002835|nr:uncharacterized protein BDF20DRAFT_909294 [Mycotypha africana]KAI8991522.1 hypothetical protein BDF20DRAFT_909294 [Mycotypha africana]
MMQNILQKCFQDVDIPAKFVYSNDISRLFMNVAADGLENAVDSLEVVQHAELERLTSQNDKTLCMTELKHLQFLEQLRTEQLDVLRNFFAKTLQTDSFIDGTTRLPHIVLATASTMDASKFCITIITTNNKLPTLTLDDINSFPEIFPSLRCIKLDTVSIAKSSNNELIPHPNNVSHVQIKLAGDLDDFGLLGFVLNAYNKNLKSLKIMGDPNAHKAVNREKLYKYTYHLQQLETIEISEYPISVTRFLKALYISNCLPKHLALQITKQPEKGFTYLNLLGPDRMESLSLTTTAFPQMQDLLTFTQLQSLTLISLNETQLIDVEYFKPILERLSSLTIGYGKDNPSSISYNLPSNELYPRLKHLTITNAILKGDELNTCQKHCPNLTDITLIRCQIDRTTSTLSLEACELETLTLQNCVFYPDLKELTKFKVTITDTHSVFDAKVKNKHVHLDDNQHAKKGLIEGMKNLISNTVNGSKLAETENQLHIILKKIKSIHLDKEGAKFLSFHPASNKSNEVVDCVSFMDDEEQRKDNDHRHSYKEKGEYKDAEEVLHDSDKGDSVHGDTPQKNDLQKDSMYMTNKLKNETSSPAADEDKDLHGNDDEHSAHEDETTDEEESSLKNAENTKKRKEQDEDYEYGDDNSEDETDKSYDEDDEYIAVRRSTRVVERSSVTTKLRPKRQRISYDQDKANMRNFLDRVRHYKAVIRISY